MITHVFTNVGGIHLIWLISLTSMQKRLEMLLADKILAFARLARQPDESLAESNAEKAVISHLLKVILPAAALMRKSTPDLRASEVFGLSLLHSKGIPDYLINDYDAADGLYCKISFM